MLGSLLGLDAASWSAAIAACALAISAYLALGARGSAAGSKRSARAAEQSAAATSAAAEASKRAAEAAEESARQAERAAAAAERSAAAHEDVVRLDEERARHERRERADRDAPRWEPTTKHGGALWFADDNQLCGVLLNAGRVAARVSGVELELPTGGGVIGRYRAEPAGPADGGFVSVLEVHAGKRMQIEFKTSDGSLGLGLRGDAQPRITIKCASEELGWAGTRTVELLRKMPGHQPAQRWQPRAVD